MLWKLPTDKVMFPVLQISLLVFVLFAVVWNSIQGRSSGQGEVAADIIRGNVSTALFYGAYAAVSGLLISICLRVESLEYVKNSRVFWSLLNAMEMAYLCLVNGWFRNLVLTWAIQLSKIESR